MTHWVKPDSASNKAHPSTRLFYGETQAVKFTEQNRPQATESEQLLAENAHEGRRSGSGCPCSVASRCPSPSLVLTAHVGGKAVAEAPTRVPCRTDGEVQVQLRNGQHPEALVAGRAHSSPTVSSPGRLPGLYRELSLTCPHKTDKWVHLLRSTLSLASHIVSTS